MQVFDHHICNCRECRPLLVAGVQSRNRHDTEDISKLDQVNFLVYLQIAFDYLSIDRAIQG